MRKFISAFFAFGLISVSTAQDKEIINTISLIAEGVNNKNSNLIDSVFARPSALFYGTYNGIAFEPVKDSTHTAGGLAQFIENWKLNKIDVQQHFDSISVKWVENGIAQVETHYKAYKDEKLTHFGKEYYTLVKMTNGWKILSCAFEIKVDK